MTPFFIDLNAKVEFNTSKATINPFYIMKMRESTDKFGSTSTAITMSDGERLLAEHTIEEIKELIRESRPVSSIATGY